MKKKYSVKENNKIEEAKKTVLVITPDNVKLSPSVPLEKETDFVSVKEILDNMSEIDDDPVEVTSEEYDHDVEEKYFKDRREYNPTIPKFTYRKAISKDIVFDKEVQVRVAGEQGGYTEELRIVTILNPNDSVKAFIGSDGNTYGLDETFIKVKL